MRRNNSPTGDQCLTLARALALVVPCAFPGEAKTFMRYLPVPVHGAPRVCVGCGAGGAKKAAPAATRRCPRPPAFSMVPAPEAAPAGAAPQPEQVANRKPTRRRARKIAYTLHARDRDDLRAEKHSQIW